jgi:hypothetical protein
MPSEDDCTLVPTPARRATLRAALGFAAQSSKAPELRLLHAWLDTWRGIGDVVAGMARQDFDLELRRFDGRGWRATFFPSGIEHSFTGNAGSAWATTPWEAVQRAAAATLARLDALDVRRDWTGTDESPR